MRFGFQQRAGENERFSENAFDDQIGKIVPLNLRQYDDGPVMGTMGALKLVGVTILDEGKVAQFEMELLEPDTAVARVAAGIVEDSLIKYSEGKLPQLSFAFKERS